MGDQGELIDYEEEDIKVISQKGIGEKINTEEDIKKGSYAGIHSTGFRDFLLKPELLRAIIGCGFEHPSTVQQECIPQSILGMDVLCQAKSGMGKTAVFVLTTLQQLDPVDNEASVIVLCHTRELAFQINKEYQRFAKYLPNVKTGVYYGGTPIRDDVEDLEKQIPHIIVGTPGRILALVRKKHLNLKHIKHFVIDECDRLLDNINIRRDVQEIFQSTPPEKQIMMFTATLSKTVKEICKKFMHMPLEIYVDNEAKLTLHGLQQHYVKLEEQEKNKKLSDLLENLDFNQVVIFVRTVSRAIELNKLLIDLAFPSVCIHAGMPQAKRISCYEKFKDFEQRILVATDIFARGIDIERINLVINYDMAGDADSYLHRVGRAGRFGTKGLSISFITTENDLEVLNQVQNRFEVSIPGLSKDVDLIEQIKNVTEEKSSNH